MPEKKKEPNWLDDLDIGNIEKSAKMKILPTLRFNLDDTHIVKIIDTPIYTETKKGNFFFMCVEKEKLKYTINCAKSLRFHLAVLGKRLGGIDKLIGRTIAITKSKGSTKDFPNAEMYNIQIIK